MSDTVLIEGDEPPTDESVTVVVENPEPETESESDAVEAAVVETVVEQAREQGRQEVVQEILGATVAQLGEGLQRAMESIELLRMDIATAHARIDEMMQAEVAEAETITEAAESAEENGEDPIEAIAEATQDAATETSKRVRTWL